MSLSGTKWKITVPRWGAQIDLTFAPSKSFVQIHVVGAAEPTQGIWAVDNSGENLIIQGPSPYGWWNVVYSIKIDGSSGNGFYMLYTQHLGLADLEPCTMAKVS